MELRAYLKILRKGWWIALSVLLVTITATIVFSFLETEIYEARTTLVASPTTSSVDDTLRGLDTLSRREGIAATFAEAASSRAIFEAATQDMNLSKTQLAHLKVSSRVIPATNIIEVVVSGDSPTVAADVANQVGVELVRYVDDLYEAYNLKSLDIAIVPEGPTVPNKKRNVALGALFGLVLGLGVTYVIDYLRSPEETIAGFNIIDSETGAYNEQYFLQRLGEETARAERNRYLLSLGLMHINNLSMIQGTNSAQVRTECLRQVVSFMGQHFRPEDVWAYLEGGRFAFLFPDTSGENARAIMEYLEDRISWITFESETSEAKLNLSSTSSVMAYGHNGLGPNELLSKLDAALEKVKTKDGGEIHLISGESGRELDVETISK